MFVSDNGGRKEHAVNYPFRGHKGMLFEGGIRVPFGISWPAKIASGVRYEHPVSALDLFPTSLSAAGIGEPNLKLDGVDLLPFLLGSDTTRPHQTLYWRCAVGDQQYGYAVRDGDLKLVDSRYKDDVMLFDIANDPWERDDLSKERPAEVRRLTSLIRDWDQGNVAPLWSDAHGPNVSKEQQVRQAFVDAASRGE